MLRIKRFIFNPIGVNTYVISDERGLSALIDCGCWTETEWNQLTQYLKQNNLQVTHLINTHLHLDHVFGNQFALRDMRLKPSASPFDFPLYKSLRSQVAMFFGEQVASNLNYSFTDSLGDSLSDGDIIKIGEEELSVIWTPGHSPGGLCFYNSSSKILISGDTLFQMSIGRTDLVGGDYSTLIDSIKTKLFILPPDTVVYPGHGDTTTIDYEMNYNPYVGL